MEHTAPTNQKQFPTLDVVTMATGILVSDRGLDAVYETGNWLLSDELMTHQLVGAFDACKPIIEAQHPWIADLTPPKGDVPALKAWCVDLVATRGDTLALVKPETANWVTYNALKDLTAIADKRAIVLLVDPERP